MLNFTQGGYRCCDGISRRSLLKAGTLTFGGLGLADWLRLKAHANPTRGSLPNKSVSLLWKGGGPCPLGLWDMKPNASIEYGG